MIGMNKNCDKEDRQDRQDRNKPLDKHRHDVVLSGKILVENISERVVVFRRLTIGLLFISFADRCYVVIVG